jgi:predicted esterase
MLKQLVIGALLVWLVWVLRGNNDEVGAHFQEAAFMQEPDEFESENPVISDHEKYMGLYPRTATPKKVPAAFPFGQIYDIDVLGEYEGSGPMVIVLHGAGDHFNPGTVFNVLDDIARSTGAVFLLPKHPAKRWFVPPKDSRERHLLQGFDRSVERVSKMVSYIRTTFPGRKVMLMGFSNGAPVLAEAGLQKGKNFVDHVILVSGYLVQSKLSRSAVQDTPISIVHGLRDEVVQYDWAQASLNGLLKVGARFAQLFPTPKGHVFLTDELIALLRRVLSA